MGSKTSEYFINPSIEDNKSTLVKYIQQRHVTNDKEKETVHANLTQGSNQALMVLVMLNVFSGSSV